MESARLTSIMFDFAVQFPAPTYRLFCSFILDQGNPKLAKERIQSYHLAGTKTTPPRTFPEVIILLLKAQTICLKAGRSKVTAPGKNYEDLALSERPVNGKHKR